jgi:hypothetical protein
MNGVSRFELGILVPVLCVWLRISDYVPTDVAVNDPFRIGSDEDWPLDRLRRRGCRMMTAQIPRRVWQPKNVR